ncbi:MAG: beta-N-acetylhexosaminidase [bacterium]|nr:beta-N-acetylhexosaminidase [bacterium]
MTPARPLIPYPHALTHDEGHFVIDSDTQIRAMRGAEPAADWLAVFLRHGTGFPILTAPLTISEAEAALDNTIELILLDSDPELDDEGYRLDVMPDSIRLEANTPAGLFYGAQTLRQLLPAELETPPTAGEPPAAVPCLDIEDAPRYRWRGLHLDCARHMMPVAFIKRFLDWMALHKFNTFHWHLTDDQGWRIEIKAYPRLTEIGSQRAATPIPADRKTLDGQPYGGFYTQDEVRDVIAYAADRFITVVPEIEMPGHAAAALASYPELGCVGSGYQVRTFWGIEDDVFCAGNDQVFTFLENVLSEVIDLFPSAFIHVGGDECPKVRWEQCPKCQAAIAREGLKDEHELQSWFIRRMETFLNAKGRRLIGWDEILEGGLAPNATVMSWRGTEGGIAAAAAGHDVVMSPMSHCYLDYYQSEDTDNEPPAIGGYLPIDQVYRFNPAEGVPADKSGHVLGGQGNLWTEYMPTEAQVEYMAYPRAAALAEALWTAPAERDYGDFAARLNAHLLRLDALGVRYRQPNERES